MGVEPSAPQSYLADVRTASDQVKFGSEIRSISLQMG
jgi:hypothetical protein